MKGSPSNPIYTPPPPHFLPPQCVVCGQIFYLPYLFRLLEGLYLSLKVGGYKLWLKVNDRFFCNFICAGFSSQGSRDAVPGRRNFR